MTFLLKKIYPPLVLLSAIMGLSGAQANAQQNVKNDRSIFYDYGETFFSEAHAGASASKDSSKIFVYFKVIYDALSFTATSASERSQGTFKTSPTVNVECRDEIGVIRQRAEWKRNIFTQSFDETNSKTRYALGAFELNVPAGKYTVTLDVTDQTGSIIRRIKLPPVNAQSFLKTTATSDVQFVHPSDGSETRSIRPFSLGGNVPFSSGGFRAIASISGLQPDDLYTYVVSQVKTTEAGNVWGRVGDIVGQVRPQGGDILHLSVNTIDEIRLEYTPAAPQGQSAPSSNSPSASPDALKSSAGQLGILDVAVPGQALVPGKYQIQLYRSGGRDTITQAFEVIWDNMPLSLRNSKYAAETMYYILSDAEYEQILKGSESDIKAKIFAYWRGKDPSPQTAFNEALAQYFGRVDYAFFNFQTIEERDGAKTERGKIYILHGKPTAINRSYEPDKPVMERWRYENSVNKEFVFEAITDGRFKLKEIVEISSR